MNDGLLVTVRTALATRGGMIAGILVSLGLLGLAGWVVVHRDSAAEKAQELNTVQHELSFYCRACKGSGKIMVSNVTKWPVECPLCHKVEAIKGMTCICGKTIEKHANSRFACPYCGHVYDWRTPSGEDRK